MSRVSLPNAAMPLVLALDIGTSSVRAILFDREGRLVEQSEAQHPYRVSTTVDGGAEAPAEVVFDLLVRCLDEALDRIGDRATEIAAVGASCFWHSLVGLDGDGTSLTPIYYWGDTRSVHQVDQLRAEVDVEEMHRRTGCPLHSNFWPPKLRWLRDRDPEGFGRVKRWCSFAEYAWGRFQGTTDPGTSIAMASGTGMLNVHDLVWDEETVKVAGVTVDQLSPIIDFDAPYQGLADDYARRWPILDDVPWFPAIGDGACANIGGGAKRPDRLALTLGTSGAVRMVTTEVDLLVPDGLWMYRLDRQHGILGGGMSNGGNLTAWLRNLLGRDYDDAVWSRVGEREPDGHGLTVLPFLAGERAPAWNSHANGVIAGLTLATEPVDLLRAGMEAVAYRCGLVYRQLAPFAEQPHQIVAGGAAILNSPDWLQIIADVFNHDILAPDPDEEASARGAAVATLIAIGELAGFEAAPDPVQEAAVFRPDPARHQIYRAALDRHETLESLLFPHKGSWSN